MFLHLRPGPLNHVLALEKGQRSGKSSSSTHLLPKVGSEGDLEQKGSVAGFEPAHLILTRHAEPNWVAGAQAPYEVPSEYCELYLYARLSDPTTN